MALNDYWIILQIDWTAKLTIILHEDKLFSVKLKNNFRFGKLFMIPKISNTYFTEVYKLGSENFLKFTTA